MADQKTIRRSKIYTYFYGRNTTFQQFLIVAAVFLMLLATVAGKANIDSWENKKTELYTAQQNAYNALSQERQNLRDNFDVYVYGTEELKNFDSSDPAYAAKNAYNDAIAAYNKAQEKYQNHCSSDPSDSFLGGLFKFLGWVTLLVAIFWSIYKKFSFNKDGEREYDEELKDVIAAAKVKALDKLNIVAEQIDKVEPVVLNGVGHTNDTNPSLSAGFLLTKLKNLVRWILVFDKIIIFSILSGILLLIASLMSANIGLFIFGALLVLAAEGYIGYYVFKKCEKNSFVPKRVFKRLEKFVPRFFAKLGSDDSVRVSLPAIVVYMFGDDQLYVYYQYVDIVTGKIFTEGVHEYFYEDIVGITSAQETKKIFKRCGFMKLFLKSIDYLRESITIVTSGCTYSESYIVGMGNSLLDTQFTGMRNLVRQKKAEK